MKKNVARFTTILTYALLTAVLAGCMNPFGDSNGNGSASADSAGSVEVTLGTLSASTIVPDVAGLVDEHRVTLSRAGYGDITTTSAAGAGGSGSITVSNVPVGTWDILVESVDTDQDPDVVVGVNNGADTVTVTQGTTTSVGPISVVPTSGGTGGLDLTVSWPSGEVTAIAEDTLTLLSGSILDVALSLTGTPATGATYTNTSLASGSYTLLLRLERDDGSGPVNVATVIEAIHIYDNVTTTGSITLTSSDIAQPPAAPSSLTATVSGSGGTDTIDLSWTDNSNTETGFEIERSEDGGSSWTTVTTTEAGATSYSDTGLVAGTTYTYRVRSENDFGASAWSSSENATTNLGPIHVSTSGSDTTGDGSAVSPFASIQHAIDQAVAGQDVLVAGGTYSVTFPGIEMKEGVSLYGAYDGGSVPWVRNPAVQVSIIEDTSTAEPSTGDYDYTWSGGTLNHEYNNPTTAVRFFDGITANTVLDGFTIRGTSNATRPTHGGAILIYNSSPTITNNVVHGADALTGSYVIQAYQGGSPLIDGNTLTGGDVDGSSGSPTSLVVNGWQASPVFTDNTLQGGTSTGQAGNVGTGVVQVGGSGSVWTFRGNTISSGESDNYLQGTVRIVQSEGVFDKNRIIHQTDSNNHNGQVFDLNRSDVVISNNLIETTTTGDDTFRWFYVAGSQVDIVSNTVVGTNDSTHSFNDGIYLQKYGTTTYSTATVRNNLFYTDGTSSSYEPIYVQQDSTATVENNYLTALDTDHSADPYFGSGGNSTTQYTTAAQGNFVDFAGGDYRLGTNAVRGLRGGGQNLSDDGYGSYVGADYDGSNRTLGYNASSAGTVSNANAEGWSMGAFEQDG